MNGIQFDIFKDFNPPQFESVLSFRLLKEITAHIFTFGFCGVYENERHQYHIRI